MHLVRLTSVLCCLLVALAAAGFTASAALGQARELPTLPLPPLPGDTAPATVAPQPSAPAPGAPATPVPAPGVPATPVVPADVAPAAVPPGATAAPAAPAVAAPSSADSEAHWAKGEVLYNGSWMPIDDLFKLYLATRGDLAPLAAKATEARQKSAELQGQMANLKNDTQTLERPSKIDIAKARKRQQELKKILDTKPPAKPQLLNLPPQPKQGGIVRNGGGSGSSGNYGNNNNNVDPYQQMLQQWQQQCQIITQANTQLTQKYTTEATALKKQQDDANKEMPKLEKTNSDGDAKVQQLEQDLETKLTPMLDKVKAANEDVAAADRETSGYTARLKAIADALRASPETLRFKHGIVEWEGRFAPLAELQKYLTDTQAEIERVRAQMKAEADAAGRPFPSDWRHPQQDRLDALKALIAKVLAVTGGVIPAAPVVSATDTTPAKAPAPVAAPAPAAAPATTAAPAAAVAPVAAK